MRVCVVVVIVESLDVLGRDKFSIKSAKKCGARMGSIKFSNSSVSSIRPLQSYDH